MDSKGLREVNFKMQWSLDLTTFAILFAWNAKCCESSEHKKNLCPEVCVKVLLPERNMKELELPPPSRTSLHMRGTSEQCQERISKMIYEGRCSRNG